jgi:hypothetical protein
MGARPGPACVTPCTLPLEKRSTYRITFGKPGFEPVTARLKPRVAAKGAAGFAGNVIVRGVVGGVVDVASAPHVSHCRNPLVATLRPATAHRRCTLAVTVFLRAQPCCI